MVLRFANTMPGPSPRGRGTQYVRHSVHRFAPKSFDPSNVDRGRASEVCKVVSDTTFVLRCVPFANKMHRNQG